MDKIDILVMIEKNALEVAQRDMNLYEERFKKARENYMDSLRIKNLKDTDPKLYEEIMVTLEEDEKDFENIMLDMTLSPTERIMKKIRKTEK